MSNKTLWQASNELSIQIGVASRDNKTIPQNILDAWFVLNDVLFQTMPPSPKQVKAKKEKGKRLP